MPRYDYKCGDCSLVKEIVHSIEDCDKASVWCTCGSQMHRAISASHIEGSLVYPFELWNIRLPKGQEFMTINNKAEHKRVLAERGFRSPFFSVGG